MQKQSEDNSPFDGGTARCQAAGRPWLVGYNEEKKLVIKRQPDCGLWSCPHCGMEKQKEWFLLTARGVSKFVESGLQVRFVTLTARPGLTISRTLLSFAAAWPKLNKRIRRNWPEWEYVAVAELHKSGKMHMHLVGTCGASTHWLHTNAYQCGLGYQAKAIAVGNGNQCGGYVTKYLSKSLSVSAWPANFRRVRRSQGWPDLPPHTLADGWEWLTLKSERAADWEVAAMQDSGYVLLGDG